MIGEQQIPGRQFVGGEETELLGKRTTLAAARLDFGAHPTDAKWDESEHPRDDSGRFGSGSGDRKFSTKTEKEAKKKFYDRLNSGYDKGFGGLTTRFAHESPGYISSAFMKQGISNEDQGVFASIGDKSDFVSGKKTRVWFRIPQRVVSYVRPDMRYDADFPFSDLIDQHSSIKGADVFIQSKIQPEWIDHIEHVDEKGKATVIFHRDLLSRRKLK